MSPFSLLGTSARMRGLAGNTTLLFKFLGIYIVLALLASWLLIELGIGRERRHMLDSMEERAQALVWSIEGSARYMHKRDVYNLAGLLREIGRQPGIAWLALVNSQGKIVLDSNEELDNTQLYTPAEMAALAAGDNLQGRFSPDDPHIYETWKLFRPGKLGGHPGQKGQYVIFIAIDAAGFTEQLKYVGLRLWLFALAVNLALLCLAALAFYVYSLDQSRKKLARTEAFALQVIASYPAALLVCDMEGNILLANENAEKMFDIPGIPANLKDLAFYDWTHIFRSLARQKPLPDEEMDLHLKNGQCKAASMSAALVPGNPQPACLLVFRDLDEIRHLKRKLEHSERLSEAGRLASGLAHEIRNPLSSIRGYAHYLETRLQNDAMGKAAASLLVEETARINNVLSGLLNIARQPVLELARNPLPALLEKAISLVRPDARARGIELEFGQNGVDPQGPWPLSDRDKLLQAFLNILLNAAQATPDGGRVSIALQARKDGNGSVKGWNITFRDNGKGMSETVRKQIFTPYFTTRPDGTGLGLAITRQIVESHAGSIEAASTPGNGAIFTIFLPQGTNSAK